MAKATKTTPPTKAKAKAADAGAPKAPAAKTASSTKTVSRPKVGAKTEAAIRAKLKAGVGMTRAARELGVGVSTVVRVKGELEGAA